MRIAVIGAGAIGGMLAVRFALSGHTVTVVDRGAHLEAIRKNGLKLVHHDGAEEVAHRLTRGGELRRCRFAGPRAAGAEGLRDRRRRAADARTVWRRHDGRDVAEWPAVVVLPEFQRPARGLPAQIG